MRRILITAALLASALTLAGCTAGTADSGASTSGGVASAPVGAPEPATDGSKGTSGGGTTVTTPREVVMSGTVTITASDPIGAATRAVTIVETAGGRVDARTQTARTETAAPGATLTLRIPAAVLTATLAKLKTLGAVQTIDLSANDVTSQGQDLDARITALTTSVNRLLALESKSADVDTLIKLESAISDRQGELDSLVSQRKLLSDEVAMATVELRLISPADTPVTAPTTPWDALLAGLAGFGAFFTSVFLVIVYLLPWLLLGSVIALAVLWIVRRRRRRATPAS
ncbi:DUF4349 domain-containing protein [Galbitalea soli]|uniref:DUF4349 domain-containing protein n=1 Tax=Galbitalea soli TaxID=1268042 RepID=A0A7C9PKF5_9MICO|nr:DUF4349 domain-containing protein [Galbitalea soli]NEM89770.1 DUF4349 domain-containing protein [Galbitalea soli]NYJ30472.1 outer membrane murein-binding lipoprotein Lpp [Galbitalea soli]